MRFGLAGDERHRLAAEPRDVFRQRRLVGEGRDHAEAVLAGDVGGGEDADDAGLPFGIGVEIAEGKAGADGAASGRPVRRAHRPESVSAPNFSAPVTLGTPSSRTGEAPTALPVSGSRAAKPSVVAPGVHHRCDDLAVAGAAAEHAAERIADLGLAGPGISLQQRGRGDQQRPACRCRIAPRHVQGRTIAGPTACRWRGPRPCAPREPAADAAGTRQAQTGSPSSSTVQAPQSPASQPTLVPVSRR